MIGLDLDSFNVIKIIGLGNLGCVWKVSNKSD
jgi:hypothetical protein